MSIHPPHRHTGLAPVTRCSRMEWNGSIKRVKTDSSFDLEFTSLTRRASMGVDGGRVRCHRTHRHPPHRHAGPCSGCICSRNTGAVFVYRECLALDRTSGLRSKSAMTGLEFLFIPPVAMVGQGCPFIPHAVIPDLLRYPDVCVIRVQFFVLSGMTLCE